MQGVGFRAGAARAAASAGAAGWVRNREDGSVELVVEGDEAAVEAVVAFARRGPRGAEVEAVDEAPAQPEGLSRFEVR